MCMLAPGSRMRAPAEPFRVFLFTAMVPCAVTMQTHCRSMQERLVALRTVQRYKQVAASGATCRSACNAITMVCIASGDVVCFGAEHDSDSLFAVVARLVAWSL